MEIWVGPWYPHPPRSCSCIQNIGFEKKKKKKKSFKPLKNKNNFIEQY